MRKVTAVDAQARDRFGRNVSVVGDVLAVGSPSSPNLCPICSPGAAYVFGRDQGGFDNWGQVSKVGAPEGQPGDLFGGGVELDPVSNLLVVTASRTDAACPSDPNCDSGAGYVYALSVSCDNSLGIACPPTGDPQSSIVGLDVQLNGGWANLDPPCRQVTLARWDWDDGTVEDFPGNPPGPFPNQHTYATGGAYTVTVSLFDDFDILLDEATCSIEVAP